MLFFDFFSLSLIRCLPFVEGYRVFLASGRIVPGFSYLVCTGCLCFCRPMASFLPLKEFYRVLPGFPVSISFGILHILPVLPSFT